MDDSVLFEIPRNFSYEADYHQLYYYPRLILQQLKNHRSPSMASDTSSINRTASGSLPSLIDSPSSNSFVDVVTENSRWELVEEGGEVQKYRLRRMSSISTDDVMITCSKTESLRFEKLVTDIQNMYNKSKNTSSIKYLTEEELEEYLRKKSNGKTNGLKEKSKTSGNLVHSVSNNSCLTPMKRSASLRSVSLDDNQNVTRRRKKSVRFADSLGLELNTVRRMTGPPDQPPIFQSSVFEGLRKGVEEANRTVGIRHVCLCFKPPGDHPNFLKRVISDRVVLETCVIGPLAATVTGTIRVMNLCYRKDVVVRYTLNNWITFNDINASYIIDSNDSLTCTDRFSFTITLPATVSVSSRLSFVVKYVAVDVRETFWDNNKEKNYELECCAKVVPICESDSAWMHFL